MSFRNVITLLVLILVLSTIGISIWLFEILQITGWYGLNWVSEHLYSPYILSFLAAFVFTTPFIINKTTSLQKIIIAIIILGATNIICFSGCKYLHFAFYCGVCYWSNFEIAILFSIGLLFYGLFGFMYWFTTNKFIRKIKKLNILFFLIMEFLTIPLSILSIHLNTGFGSQTGWIDAVKMGYPIFWTMITLGISAIIITSRILKHNQ